jgi:hypothetical protein
MNACPQALEVCFAALIGVLAIREVARRTGVGIEDMSERDDAEAEAEAIESVRDAVRRLGFPA